MRHGRNSIRVHRPRLDRVLRCVVGAGARRGEQSTDRRHEYHPPPGVTDLRQHRLRNCDLRDDVDAELLCQIIGDKPSTGPLTMMPALLTTPFSSAGS